MSDKANLKRIKADLEEAQSEIETASKIDDSLGGSLSFGFGSLLAAVGQLFTRTNDHESKIGKHDIELKLIQFVTFDRATGFPIVLTEKQKPLPRYDLLGITAPYEIEIACAAIDNLGYPAPGVGFCE